MSEKDKRTNVWMLMNDERRLTSALETVALPGCSTSTTIWRLQRETIKITASSVPFDRYLQSSRLVMYFLVRIVTDPSTMVLMFFS